ncbi:MAG TPA: DUF1707 domain-containing protein [Solirubrobacteraceae bacterium]|nr:DUF1707 domain-containing protein [Solirubrobacteraceae bacterium]
MRLTDADRDRLLEQLSRHAAVGTIDTPEHERRAELVLRAGTRETALNALADLPPLPGAGSGPAQAPRGRGRGHGEVDVAEADWQPTSERFRDPRSGLVMRVWVDPGGGRHYVAEPPE